MTAATAHPVDKSQDRIRRMFGAIAPYYDLLNHLLSLNIDRRWRARTVQLVPPRGTEPILDLCTGTGDLALAYHQAGAGAVPVVAADFCAPMLDRATRKRAPSTGPRWVQADAQRLPFPSDSFQIVAVAFGLRNVADTDAGLAEMVRVLRPGGRLAILEFSRPRHPLLGQLYRGYFTHILPRIGQTISGTPARAYDSPPASVLQFPDGEVLADRLRHHGLVHVRFEPLTFGIASLYVGEKA
ncbi:MAG TPA: ubiquinone/menaquinone biosynthesis methyltransferase [Gemmatales bacterium]|nr:ubiquinone/menaquinone biosynthesis methyltransferase [Gemmatales bacterium]